MRISIASDHGGFNLKEIIKKHLEDKYDIIDYGCFNLDSCDYPDFAYKAALAVSQKEADFGIVVCTTGIGVSITANKVKNIRCALLTDIESAKLTRLHNDSNMLALGAKNVSEELALKIVDMFLSTPFSGEERHQRRIDKMMKIEKEN